MESRPELRLAGHGGLLEPYESKRPSSEVSPRDDPQGSPSQAQPFFGRVGHRFGSGSLPPQKRKANTRKRKRVELGGNGENTSVIDCETTKDEAMRQEKTRSIGLEKALHCKK